MKNKYEIHGEETIIFIRKQDGSMIHFLIDTEDFDLVNRFTNTWGQLSRYIGIRFSNSSRKREYIYLHRIITNAPKDKVVDHINHNTFDNRRCNLRVVSISENSQNRSGATSISKSGVRGVVWSVRDEIWKAQYRKCGKQHYVGSFKTKAEAESAVIKARTEVFPYSNGDTEKVRG
ncbi:HNH endonuclease [Paenibacillus sp. FSL K6-1217]|uniref:HNH endonuclease n=1 Tax=Paenibacillus sp. FSL K6-1217 TaxID=2921466 RepID=UPI003249BCDD